MIGIDIVKVARFKNMKNLQAFLNKYFTNCEIEYVNMKKNKFESIAGLFSAKESVLKVLGIGLFNKISLIDIEINHDNNGKPNIKLYNEAERRRIELGYKKIEVSISHTFSDAVSTALGVLNA